MAGELFLFLVGQLFLFVTTSAQCPEPCTPCKVFPDGVYQGTWNLKAEIHPRCNGSCLYQRNSDEKEMCFCDPGPYEYETCNGCGCTGCKTANKWIVVTGGDHSTRNQLVNNVFPTIDQGRLKSSDIITSTGVCDPIASPTIPLLPDATSAGEMAFMLWDYCLNGALIFCGGSTTFVDHTMPVSDWGATNVCYKLPTTAPNTWTVFPGMLEKRAWFSLTKIDENTMIAVGGIDSFGGASNTMEQYSFLGGGWTLLPTVLPAQRFGHCTVYSQRGTPVKPYLIVIGGSENVPSGSSWKAVDTVYEFDVDGGTTRTLSPLPEPLFRPACTITCDGDIFVSGGAVGDVPNPPAGTTVYKYTFATGIGLGTWSTVGSLNTKRWGHVMGKVGANANRKMSVAGGFTGFTGTSSNTFLKNVEDSIHGATWTNRRTNLLVEREYAASAEVPANIFRCQG